MFYSSLKTKRVFNADIMGLPKEPTFSNYQKIMTNADYHIGQSKSVIEAVKNLVSMNFRLS